MHKRIRTTKADLIESVSTLEDEISKLNVKVAKAEASALTSGREAYSAKRDLAEAKTRIDLLEKQIQAIRTCTVAYLELEGEYLPKHVYQQFPAEPKKPAPPSRSARMLLHIDELAREEPEVKRAW